MKYAINGYGINHGLTLYNQQYYVSVDENGIVTKKRHNKKFNIIFLRAFSALWFFVYNFISEFDTTTYNMSRKQKIWFPIIFVGLVVTLFILLPLGFFALLENLGNSIWVSMLYGFLRVNFFLLFMYLLKFVEPIKNVYKYNFCVNKIVNSYSRSNVNYIKYDKASGYRIFSNFNFLILTAILSIFSFSFVAISNVWLNAVIKIVVIICSISIAYELLYVVQYLKDYKNVKFLSYLFLWINYFCTLHSTGKEDKTSLRAMEEFEIMNKTTEEGVSKANFGEVFVSVKKQLTEAGIMDDSETEWLIASALDKNRNDIYTVGNITRQQQEKINKILKERVLRKPLDKIINKSNFFGYDFYVNSNVLSPRQETEILVENAIKLIADKPLKVLDLCTGSGVIGITIALKTKANVTCTDICSKALKVAEKNSKNLKAKIKLIKSNLFNELDKTKKFDIIVSNPPYIKTSEIDALEPEVKNFDPKKSLDGGKDGLMFYKKIIKEAPEFLKKDGYIMLEIGYTQEAEVTELLKKNKFKNILTIYDFADLPRVIVAQKG